MGGTHLAHPTQKQAAAQASTTRRRAANNEELRFSEPAASPPGFDPAFAPPGWNKRAAGKQVACPFFEEVGKGRVRAHFSRKLVEEGCVPIFEVVGKERVRAHYSRKLVKEGCVPIFRGSW